MANEDHQTDQGPTLRHKADSLRHQLAQPDCGTPSKAQAEILADRITELEEEQAHDTKTLLTLLALIKAINAASANFAATIGKVQSDPIALLTAIEAYAAEMRTATLAANAQIQAGRQ